MEMKNKSKIIICFLLTIIIFLGAILLGSSNISYKEILQIILGKWIGKPINNLQHVAIIWNIRIPRIMLAFFVGGSLAVSGAVIQSILKNTLASPYTLGVSSGASLGAAIIIISGLSIPQIGIFTLPIMGFIGGLFTVYAVIYFAKKVDKELTNNTVILAGMVFSLFVNGILTILTAAFHQNVEAIALWQMGTFAMKGWKYVICSLLFSMIGILGILQYTKEMDILSFGEQEAMIMGVDTYKVKRDLFISTAILTGASVALSGVIGFVDLIAPHIVRRFFGFKHIFVIPMSFVFGGTLMVMMDTLSRTVVSGSELPVGAITALLGAPFFAYVYFKKDNR